MQKNDLSDNGNYEVPYALIPGATEQEAKEQLLEITSQYGHMTMEGLDEFAFDLDLTELDVNFDALDLDKFLDGLHDKDEIEEDEAPEVDEQNPPESRLGDIYQLGRHRLMCGSATEFGDVTELVNGIVPDLALTDPPYGIAVVKNGKVGADFGIAKKGNYSDVIGDDTTDTARNSWQVITELGVPKSVIFGGNYFTDFLPPSATWLVWDKRGDSGIRNTFADCELAWSNAGGVARVYSQLWNGMIREGESGQRVHPTQKPLGILSRILEDYSSADQNILDLFGGSGSTLIACEQTNRICYMMEFDPKYCDVIRKRYANHIGAEDWQAATPVIQAVEV